MTTGFGVGLCLPQLGDGVDGAVVHDVAQAAEEAGFASLWVQEHLFVPESPVSGYAGRDGVPIPTAYSSTLSPLELLSAVAAFTSSVRLGTRVLVGGYHRPVELAQRLATVDVLSAGRLVVGLGVGWSIDEHRQMDVPTERRGVRLEELVSALRVCWGPDPVAYESEFFSIPPSMLRPKPVQSHITVIGGAMTPAGCRRVVRSFDGWNPQVSPWPQRNSAWRRCSSSVTPPHHRCRCGFAPS